MRAANRAHTSAAGPVPLATGLLSRLVVAVIAIVALLLAWRPLLVQAQAVGVPAQEPASRTHLVTAGETLWSLAVRYYGDGHQWKALARRNGIPVTDEPPLKAGTRLVVPARLANRGTVAAEIAAAPVDSTVPRVALNKAGEGNLPALGPQPGRTPAGSLAAQTAGRGNAGSAAGTREYMPKAPAILPASASTADTTNADLQPATGTLMGQPGGRRVGLVDQEVAKTSRKSSEVLTVFHRDPPDAADAERRTRAVLRPNTPAPRVAEFLAAPYLTSARSLEKLGSITARVGSASVAGEAYPQQAIKTDEVELQAPTGQPYKVGDRLLAFGTPEVLRKDSVVVLPTGILEVMKADAGKPALALVRRQSGRIEAGQRLVPAPAANAQWVNALRMDTPDVPTTIMWLDAQEAQPTLQSYFILGAGSAKGLTPGDELAIYRRIARSTTEMIVATARIVRVERDHATAIITKQYQTDIAVGMPVRRYAKAP